MVRADSDLMKQAILNLVLNGSPGDCRKGGALTLAGAGARTRQSSRKFRDQGRGKSQRNFRKKSFRTLLHDKKKKGQASGWLRTSQIVDWHYGSVDFESTVGGWYDFSGCGLPGSQSESRGPEGSIGSVVIHEDRGNLGHAASGDASKLLWDWRPFSWHCRWLPCCHPARYCRCRSPALLPVRAAVADGKKTQKTETDQSQQKRGWPEAG